MALKMGRVGWAFLIATLLALASVWVIPFSVAKAKGIKPPLGLFLLFPLPGTPFLGWVMALLYVLMVEGNPECREL